MTGQATNGAVISVRSASERLRRTATSQLEQVAITDSELEFRVAGGASAVGVAMELRRWEHPRSAGRSAAIAACAVTDSEASAGSRAAALAAAAGPGRVLIGRHLAAAADLPPWLALREPEAGVEAGAAEAAWSSHSDAGGGTAPQGALAAATDRPWAMLGRQSELDSIAAAWHRVVAGGRAVHLIAGEPGVGKTRLAAEAACEVQRAGGLVLYGSGEGAEAAPLAPFAQALSHLTTRAGPLLHRDLLEFPAGHPPFARQTGERSDAGGAVGDDPGALFAATAERLGELSQRAPLMLVIEDLHECGVSALRVIEHLARTPAATRLMIVATYRPTELAPGDERLALIARLRSRPTAMHVELGGLSHGAIRGIASALRVADDDEALGKAAALAERETNGNPLFACQILHGLGERTPAAAGMPVDAPPRSLRTLIAARAHALGELAFEHLCAAAVAGPTFDPSVVAEALGVPSSELGESMAAAERAGLISAVPDRACFSFVHAITARCLYEEAGPQRRGRLHRRLAEALERRDGGARHPGQLARHWRRAEPHAPRKVERYSELAGRQALAHRDHELAADWFECALALHGAGPGKDNPERCDLLIGLGKALCFSGQPRYREVLLDAARLADRLADPNRLADAVLANNRGLISAVGDFDRERIAMLERAAERTGEHSPTLALILAQLALELTFSSQVQRRRKLAERALRLARDTGDRRALSRVLICHLIACWEPDNARERIGNAAESIAISATLDEPLDLFRGLYWQGVAQVEVGMLDEARGGLGELRGIAARTGDSTASWLCECSEAMHLALRGRLGEAEAQTQSAVELGQESAQPDALAFHASQLAAIRWQQGRLAELAPLLQAALGNNPGLPAFRSMVCLAQALRGERRAAREVLAIDVSGFHELPRDPTWLATTTTYAHAVAELGDRETSAMLAPILSAYSGRLASTSISIWGLVDHALGRLAFLAGDHEAGSRLLDQAIVEYARISAPVWRAQAGLDLLRGLHECNVRVDGPRSERLRADAERIARSSGAGLLAGAGLGAAGAGRPARARELGERIAALALTERQAEIVLLVARGGSNSAIAAELQISRRTVKRHLENIFARVGVSGRGALVALLYDD